jgi:tetratricopeptide (TPR) repeat protein
MDGLTPATPREAAHAALRDGRLAEAEQHFASLCSSTEATAGDFAGFAKTAEASGDNELAIERWQACLARAAGKPPISWRLAPIWALYRLRKYAEADAAFSAVADDVPQDATPVRGRAFCAMRQGRWADAVRFWDEAIRRTTGECPVDWLIGRARCLVDAGDNERAANAYADLLASHPDLAAVRDGETRRRRLLGATPAVRKSVAEMDLAERLQHDLSGMHPHVSIHDVIYSVNISLRYKYFYVATPKCGCSTMKLALLRLELGDPSLDRGEFEDIHNRNFSPLLSPRQVVSFRQMASDPAIFKFCFVRHPYTRLLSCYLDKIERNRPQKAQILRQLGLPEHDLSAKLSFKQFAVAVAEQPVSSMDGHWRVQYFHTMQRSIDYDLIGRFEHFDEDARRAGARISPDFESCLRAERRHATAASVSAEQYLTPEIKEIIYRKYRIDFEHFHYDP